MINFFVLSHEESFLTFNSNILETNLFNILLLFSLLFYAYKVSFRGTLETRQAEILQSIENAQKDVLAATNYYSLSEKAFLQSLFWLNSWKKIYQEEKTSFVTNKYNSIHEGLKESFLTSQSLIKNFEGKSLSILQRYILFLTASKILRKFFFLSKEEQSKLLKLTIKKLGEINK